MSKKDFDTGSKVPWQVKTIAILHYIATGLCILIGLFMLLGAKGIVSSLVASSPDLEGILTSGMIVAIGIVFFAAGVLAFFIGRGLWKLRLWAKIVAIIFAILGFLSALVSVFVAFRWTLIINLIVYGLIGGYLLFDKEAKKIFK